MRKNKWACIMHSHWDFDDECYLAAGFDNDNNYYIEYTYIAPDDSGLTIYYKVNSVSCKHLAYQCRVKVDDLVDYFAKNFPRGKENEGDCDEIFDYKWIRWTRDSILDYFDIWGIRYLKKEYIRRPAEDPLAIIDLDDRNLGQSMKVIVENGRADSVRIFCSVYDRNDIFNQGTLTIDIDRDEACKLGKRLNTKISRLPRFFFKKFRRFEDENYGMEEATDTVENIFRFLKMNKVNYKLTKTPRY